MKILFLFLFTQLFSVITNAQNPKWIVYNKDNSNFPGGSFLTSNAYDIKIDDNGHIWVGTWGAAIFNGTDWEHWHGSNSGIGDNDVYALEIIDDTTKWFGTFGSGLIRQKGEIWESFLTSNSEIPSNNVIDLDIDSQNTLWIGTMGGLASYNNNNWEVYTTTNSGLSSNQILSVYCDNDNIVWVGTYNGGLNKFDGNNWINFNSSNSGLPHNIVQEIEKDADGFLWICTWGGVAKYYNNNWNSYGTPNLPHHVVRSVHIDRFNIKWFGTENGVVKFDDNEWEIITAGDALLQGGIINTLKTDENNRLWIGTSMQGVFVYNENGIVSVQNIGNWNISNFELAQNYPNPFNPATTITYILDKPAAVDLAVYNLLGQKIATLVNRKQAVGKYNVRWDGINYSGKQVSAGVYIYRLKAGEFVQTRKMLFLK